MTDLCEIIKSNVSNSFPKMANEWSFSSTDTYSCVMKSARYSIEFTVDQRDKSVISSILFLEEPEKYSEKFYTHIITRIYPEIQWDTANGSSIDEQISSELNNVIKFLDTFKMGEISARDLHYFYVGYNTSYTDSMNEE